MRSGATMWPGPQRSTAAHVATMSAVVAASDAVQRSSRAARWGPFHRCKHKKRGTLESDACVVVCCVLCVVRCVCCGCGCGCGCSGGCCGCGCSKTPGDSGTTGPRALTTVSARRPQKNRLAQNFDCGNVENTEAKCSSRAEEASTVHTSHRVHVVMPANVGNTARGAEIPAIPAKSMPLPLSTTSAATSSSACEQGEKRRELTSGSESTQYSSSSLSLPAPEVPPPRRLLQKARTARPRQTTPRSACTRPQAKTCPKHPEREGTLAHDTAQQTPQLALARETRRARV